MKNYTKRAFSQQLAQKLTLTLIAIVGAIVIVLLISIIENAPTAHGRGALIHKTK